MNSERPFRTYDLSDDCQAVVRDATRHYYGGYYLIRLQVVAAVELSTDWFESPAAYQDALGRLGSPVMFRRTLEKMAVPEGEIDAVRHSLLSDFESNLVPYLMRPDFPRRFVVSEYAKALTQAAPFRMWQPQ